MYLERRLYRSTEEAKIAGVAVGLAEYLGLPTTFVRIVFVVLAFAFIGFPLYFLFWLLTPRDPSEGYADSKVSRFLLLSGFALFVTVAVLIAHLGFASGIIPFGGGLLAGLYFLSRARRMDAEPYRVRAGQHYPIPTDSEAVYHRPAVRTPLQDEAKIAGVCAWLGKSMRVDPVIIRVLAIIFTPITFPLLPIAYAIAALIIPRSSGRLHGSSGR